MSMTLIAKQIRREAEKEHLFETGMGTERQLQMLERWSQVRPRMYRALKEMQVEKLLAKILEERVDETFHLEQMKGVMAPADAMTEAVSQWCLMEPEMDSSPVNDLRSVLARARRMGRLPQMTSSGTTA
jgi:hypothetical protein